MITIFAAVVLEPTSLAAWIVIGLAAGWLAGKVLNAASYGMGGDLLLGAIGGFFFSVIAGADPNYWWSLLFALLGAAIFIGGARIVVSVRNA